jgi:hypothetical protein
MAVARRASVWRMGFDSDRDDISFILGRALFFSLIFSLRGSGNILYMNLMAARTAL